MQMLNVDGRQLNHPQQHLIQAKQSSFLKNTINMID